MSTLLRAFETKVEFILPEVLLELTDENYVGVDIDGTQAYYDGWKGLEHIGEPISQMVEYVKFLLSKNIKVVHFTARVATSDPEKYARAKKAIDDWSLKVYGQILPVTAVKDKDMVIYYDDKACSVIMNEGIIKN